MSAVANAVSAIRAAIEAVGAVELSKSSGVPYTTIRDWQAKGFTPSAVETLEKLAAAAETHLASQRDVAA